MGGILCAWNPGMGFLSIVDGSIDMETVEDEPTDGWRKGGGGGGGGLNFDIFQSWEGHPLQSPSFVAPIRRHRFCQSPFFFLVLFDKFTAGIPFSSSSSSSSSFHHLSLPPSSFLLPPSLEHPCASLSILKAALKAKESPRAPVPAAAARFAPRPLDGSTDRPAEGPPPPDG